MTRRTEFQVLSQLRSNKRGVAMLEFALTLPVFLGFVLTGIEVSNYVMANNRTQRLAAMTADLVSQSGVGAISASESHIYDLFSAIDLTAKPFNLRDHGRVVITSVRGSDDNGDKVIENKMLWQRFDGNHVAAAPVVGCRQTVANATLPGTRTLPLNEILFHVQVSYDYQPVFSKVPFNWINLDTTITRTAMFRARSAQFQSPAENSKFPPKYKCGTPGGL
jgi:hypothetical protein